MSLAEHLGFARAYLAASLATGAMLAIYVGAALASVVRGLVMLVVFALTYAMLYLILQLEDYALLAGAMLGFLALATVMFVTLRVDWSGVRAGDAKLGTSGAYFASKPGRRHFSNPEHRLPCGRVRFFPCWRRCIAQADGSGRSARTDAR